MRHVECPADNATLCSAHFSHALFLRPSTLIGLNFPIHSDAASAVVQINVSFTQTATALTITTPISAGIAPPGNYLVFAVSANGRPSQGIYIGLGSAAPAPLLYTTPPPEVLPNGYYTIQNVDASLANCPYLSVPACGGNNTVVDSTMPGERALFIFFCNEKRCIASIC